MIPEQPEQEIFLEIEGTQLPFCKTIETVLQRHEGYEVEIEGELELRIIDDKPREPKNDSADS